MKNNEENYINLTKRQINILKERAIEVAKRRIWKSEEFEMDIQGPVYNLGRGTICELLICLYRKDDGTPADKYFFSIVRNDDNIIGFLRYYLDGRPDEENCISYHNFFELF